MRRKIPKAWPPTLIETARGPLEQSPDRLSRIPRDSLEFLDDKLETEYLPLLRIARVAAASTDEHTNPQPVQEGVDGPVHVLSALVADHPQSQHAEMARPPQEVAHMFSGWCSADWQRPHHNEAREQVIVQKEPAAASTPAIATIRTAPVE